MNFNKSKIIFPKEQKIQENNFTTKMLFSIPQVNTKTEFPTYYSHRDITTKPEDQEDYGTCAMWTATTVCEMLIWKLTGRYMEFTEDEIYNIYLDCSIAHGEYRQMLFTKLFYCNNFDTPSYQRYLYRRSGEWQFQNTPFDSGETYYINDWGRVINHIATDVIEYTKYSPWYHIFHYNDEDHRKNHYPDKFSEICFIAKNYIGDNIYRFYNSTNEWYGDNQPSPKELKHHVFCSNFPLKCGIPGHSVAFYNYDNSYTRFNSSWNNKEVCQLQFPYDDQKPYYGTCLNLDTNKADTRFNGGLYEIEYFDRKLTEKENYILKILESQNGEVIGTAQYDSFKKGTPIQLKAIPDTGYHFIKWNDGNLSNPRKFEISCDTELQAIFSSIKPTNRTQKITIAENNDYTIEGVSNGQNIKYGESISLTCIPNPGGSFIEWGDGNTNNPRTFEISDDLFINPVVELQKDISNYSVYIDDTYSYYMKLPVGYSDIFQYILVMDENDREPAYMDQYEAKNVLINDVHYTTSVLYENIEDDDRYEVQITGKGCYKGTINKEITLRRTVSINMFVTLNKEIQLGECSAYITIPDEYIYDDDKNTNNVNIDWTTSIIKENGRHFLNTSILDLTSLSFIPKIGYEIEGFYYLQNDNSTRRYSELNRVSNNDNTFDIKTYIEKPTGSNSTKIHIIINLKPTTAQTMQDVEELKNNIPNIQINESEEQTSLEKDMNKLYYKMYKDKMKVS